MSAELVGLVGLIVSIVLSALTALRDKLTHGHNSDLG